MKIIAFGASASKTSINKVFADYTARLFVGHDIEVLDLVDYPAPLYTVDVEREQGIPQNIVELNDKLQSADLLIISMAEHNGSYTAVFKNLFDWLSRYNLKMFDQKKMLLLSTAPGGRGGLGVMEAALVRFPIHGAEIVGHFSLPRFQDNFDMEQGIIDPSLAETYLQLIEATKTQF